jgi:ribosome-associated protein
MTEDVDAALDLFFQAVQGKKAMHAVALDVRELTSFADAFIICSGRSNRQVSAIAEHIERQLRGHKIKPLSVEGTGEGHWVLMDYGSVIIHVFLESVREFYDLEGLWSDARRIPIPSAPKPKSASGRRTRIPNNEDQEPSRHV